MCLTACTFNLTDAVVLLRSLRSANLMEHLLSIAACSSILHELHDSRIFNATYNSERDFATAVQDSPLIKWSALLFSSTWLEAADPFDSPAVAGVTGAAARRGTPAVRAAPAVPARSGPPELKFLHLTTWTSVFADASGMPYSYYVLNDWLRRVLTSLIGAQPAAAFSWHSFRIELACLLP